MMIVVDDSILALWFLQISSDVDYLAALSRLPDGRLRMQWRFRYREGAAPDAWAQHRKSWYEARASMSLEAAIEQAREVVNSIGAANGRAEFFELIRGSASVAEFTAALSMAPFAHAVSVRARELQ